MKSSTYPFRLRRLILLGAAVAGLAVPAAAGASTGSPPDVRDTAASVAATNVSPPDVRDAAAGANVEVGDVFERYAAAHPYGAGLSAQATPIDRIIAQEQGRQRDLGLFGIGLVTPESSTLVSRPPDVSDAADAARYGAAVGQSSGFDWGDWAIGIGTGLGVALLLGVGLIAGRQQRHRVQPA
jgi:hypothetical protein